MSNMVIRSLKGIAMFFMYGLFLFGIFFVLLLLLPLLFLARPFWKPQPQWYQDINRFLFGIWLRLMGLFQLLRTLPSKGAPVEGPCVVIANHPGLFDVLVLIRDIPNMSVMVKNALGEQLPLKRIFKNSGYVLSPNLDTRSPLKTFYEAKQMLQNGFKFQQFPEGTRSPEGKLRRFQKGAFLLAREAGVSIQPVLIQNNPPFLHKKAKWYYPPRGCSTIELEYLEPIPPPQKGEEGTLAKKVEDEYRRALNLKQADKEDL